MSHDQLCANDEEIASYLAGRLSSDGLAEIEAHMDACGICASLVTETARAERALPRVGSGALRIFDVGQIIAGRYDILGFLGAGGMGEVYEAHDQLLGDRIALKTISAAASFDEPAVRRLKAEVQLARRVTHRNVCRIFDFGFHTEEGPTGAATLTTPFLTMELLHGRPLADHLRRGERPEGAFVVDTAHQIAAGLAAAHEVGVIHRDLKSDNVLLLPAAGSGFRAIITDFGLAGTTQATVVGGGSFEESSLHGAAPYLAPERLAGMPASAAADVYALGVIIWELTTGKLAATPGEAPRIDDVLGTDALKEIVGACLELRPDLRLQNGGAVLARLERLTGAPRPPRRRVHKLLLAALPLAGLALTLAMVRAGSRRGANGAQLDPVAPAPGAATITLPASTSTATSVPQVTPVASGAVVRHRRQVPPPVRAKSGAAAPSIAASDAPALPTVDDPARRGEALMVEGKFREACAELERARAERPGHPRVYRSLGQCYMRSGQPERAKQNYRIYLELAPESTDATFIKGILR